MRLLNFPKLLQRATAAERNGDKEFACTPGEILMLLEFYRSEKARADTLHSLISSKISEPPLRLRMQSHNG